MNLVKAAVKVKGVTSATGASSEGNDETWPSEGGLKVAYQFKADHYGMVKLTKAFHQEVQARYQLFNKNGKAATGLFSIRCRDTTKGGTSGSIGLAREAVYTIGRELIRNWYRAHQGELK